MSLLDDAVSVPRQTTTLFFLTDTSGNRVSNKIHAVHDAVVTIPPQVE